MNTNLVGEISKVKKAVNPLGVNLGISTTIDGLSVVFHNKDTHKIVLMGMVEEGGEEILAAYSVNTRKWLWAEKEGFTKDEIMDKKELAAEVFMEISIDEIPKSLI